MSLTFSNVLNINKKNYNGVTIEEKALSGKIIYEVKVQIKNL